MSSFNQSPDRFHPQSARSNSNQQNMWANAANPYSKQTAGFLSHRNPNTPGTDQLTSFSESTVPRNQESFMSNGTGLHIPTPTNNAKVSSMIDNNRFSYSLTTFL